jgi:hypothetical protein
METPQENEMPAAFIHSALDEYGLTPAQFRIYCHIARRAGSGGSAFACVDSMARVCRLHEKTIIRALAFLTDRRLLEAKRRPGRTTVYRLRPATAWVPHLSGEVSKVSTSPRKPIPNHPSQSDTDEGNPIKGNPEKDLSPVPPYQGEAEELVDLWNSFKGLPEITNLSSARRRALRRRLRETHFRENWRGAIRRVGASPFCTGQGPKGWKANVDWFLRENTVAKIMEGQYDSLRNDNPTVRATTMRDLVVRRETLLKLLDNHPGDPRCYSESREARDEFRAMHKQVEILERQIAGLPAKMES